jgi:hypothetical protein
VGVVDGQEHSESGHYIHHMSNREFNVEVFGESPEGCVAFAGISRGPGDLVKMLEGPQVGHFSKTVKHVVCSEFRRWNTSVFLSGSLRLRY